MKGMNARSSIFFVAVLNSAFILLRLSAGSVTPTDDFSYKCA